MDNSFFYHNRGEQAALIILIMGIIVLKSFCFNNWRLDSQNVQQRRARDSARMELQAYAQSFKTTLNNKNQALDYKNQIVYNKSMGKENTSTGHLFIMKHFDPNKADSILLISFGIKPYVVRNVLKYRANGGVFRQKNDLAKIYGLSQDDYERLEPYILLPEQRAEQSGLQTSVDLQNQALRLQSQQLLLKPDSAQERDSFEQHLNPMQAMSFLCRINSADTTELTQIPGIGKYSAKRILEYRNRLGGFYCVEQLDEITGLYPENLKVLKQCLQIDSGEIRKLNLNQCSLEQFRAHPYLNFYQSKALIDLRLARGRIECAEDLLFLEEFTATDLSRLRPYLGIEASISEQAPKNEQD